MNMKTECFIYYLFTYLFIHLILQFLHTEKQKPHDYFLFGTYQTVVSHPCVKQQHDIRYASNI